MEKLDKSSPVPLYFQLQELIKNKIENKNYKKGDLIPTEEELQKKYSVSRSTVRKAIEGLVFEGLLHKKQGKGTKVASSKVIENFSSLKSFTEKMNDQGKDVKTKVIQKKQIGASKRIAKHLGIDLESLVIFVQRVRYIDNKPIALFNSYFLNEIGITKEDDFKQSIYNLLENKYGVNIKKGKKVIEVARASEEEAQLLSIEEGEPILLIKNTTINDENKPVEYAEGVYRGDRYKYELVLNR